MWLSLQCSTLRVEQTFAGNVCTYFCGSWASAASVLSRIPSYSFLLLRHFHRCHEDVDTFLLLLFGNRSAGSLCLIHKNLEKGIMKASVSI